MRRLAAEVMRDAAAAAENASCTECFAKRGETMMPLTLANAGEENIIKKVGGSPETKKFLESLGFVAGGTVTVVSAISGNVIVNVKSSRVAVSKEMAQRIMV